MQVRAPNTFVIKQSLFGFYMSITQRYDLVLNLNELSECLPSTLQTPTCLIQWGVAQTEVRSLRTSRMQAQEQLQSNEQNNNNWKNKTAIYMQACFPGIK